MRMDADTSERNVIAVPAQRYAIVTFVYFAGVICEKFYSTNRTICDILLINKKLKELMKYE